MCVKPIKAFIPEFGRPILDKEGDCVIPCGTCHECITLRASDWGCRVQHELGEHNQNCCVTLTYSDDHLPNLLQRKRNYQLFMKKLRRKFKKKILSLVSHEFGSVNGRIHHHAILFGISFDDMTFYKKSKKGTNLFRSRLLSELWSDSNGKSLGWANIGEASAKAGFYIASYALKKCSQEVINEETGEITIIEDSMDASKNPGIGLRYLRRNHRQMVLRGDRLPRYYIDKMKEFSNLTLDKIIKIIDKKGIDEIDLMSDMYESYCIYEQSQDYEVRSEQEILQKYKIFRKKFLMESDFRKKMFTKNQNIHYNRFLEEFKQYLPLEEKCQK
jgi:hypothetical protein